MAGCKILTAMSNSFTFYIYSKSILGISAHIHLNKYLSNQYATYKSSEYILSYFGGLVQIETDIFYPIFILGFQHIMHFKLIVDIKFVQNMFHIMFSNICIRWTTYQEMTFIFYYSNI